MYFVIGCDDLIVAVDHKPLLKLFGDRSLEDIPNNRLRNLKEKTLRYRFRMVHIPGIRHRAADCISRYPTGEPEKLFLEDDVAALPVPQIRIDVIGYLTPYFLINRVKSKLKGFSDCFHSHNLK